MITSNGKTHVKRYQAGFVPSIARSVAIGIGNASESVNDTKLQFEVGREDITLTSFDFVNNRLIFKAPLPDDFGGSIYEVGLYSTSRDEVAGEYGSRLLTTFDSASEEWVNATTLNPATFTASGVRVGTDAIRHTPAAGGTTTDSLRDIFLDLSGYSNADKFVFAYNVGNANTSSINFRFMTDASNYYTVTLGAQTSGYKIVEAAKSTASVTGTPSWANITEIRVSTNSTAGGASQVDFDAIRIEDVDTLNPDYLIVARKVITPFTKQDGKTQEVEYSLDITA